MPKVSIILTSFNHAQFIAQAIDSVLAQTFTDFEFIIWDDASIDNSWEIIQSYTDQRIRAFRNTRQQRGSWIINKAVAEVACGEYLAVHHSDDLWMPDKLAKQIMYLDMHPETAAVFTGVQVINEQGNIFTQIDHPYARIFEQPNRNRHEWLRFFLENGNALCHPSVCMRVACLKKLGGYRHGLGQLGDFDLWVRLCLRHQIYIVQEKLTAFRVLDGEKNSSAMTRRNSSAMFLNSFIIFDNYKFIRAVEDFFAMFPELKQKCEQKTIIPVQYMLAMRCYEKNYWDIGELFGLRVLFELLQNNGAREILHRECNFSINDFIEMTKAKDVFAIRKIQALNEKINDLGRDNANLRSQLKQQDQLFNEKKYALENEKNELHALLAQSRMLLEKRDAKIHELVTKSIKEKAVPQEMIDQ